MRSSRESKSMNANEDDMKLLDYQYFRARDPASFNRKILSGESFENVLKSAGKNITQFVQSDQNTISLNVPITLNKQDLSKYYSFGFG